jgi:hypothetical protein
MVQSKKQRNRNSLPRQVPRRGRGLVASSRRLQSFLPLLHLKKSPRLTSDPRLLEPVPEHHPLPVPANRTPTPRLPNPPTPVPNVPSTATSWMSSLGRQKKRECRPSPRDLPCGILNVPPVFSPRSNWDLVRPSIQVAGLVLRGRHRTPTNALSPRCLQECARPRCEDQPSTFLDPDHKEALLRPDRSAEHPRSRRSWFLPRTFPFRDRSYLPVPSHWVHCQHRPV